MSESPQKTWVIGKAIITGSDAKFLALRRSKTDPSKPLTWDLPGGIVEYGEDPAQATIREAMEEAGQVISGLRPIFVSSTTSDSVYAIVLVFMAEAESMAVELSYEHDQYEWVTREQFLALDSTDGLKAAVASIKLD